MKALLFWLFMVFVVSVYPFENMSRYSFDYADKILHFLIYGITCVLLYKVMSMSRKPVLIRMALPLAIIFASAYGLAMEIAQGFVSARTFSLWDEAVNVFGALTGAGFVKMIGRKK